MQKEEQMDLDELESMLFGVEGNSTPSTMGFRVDSPDKAAWTARKIVQAESRIERQKTLAAEYRKRIDAWLEKTTLDDIESIAYLRSLLKPYAIDSISELKKGKTLKYLGATVSLRKLPDTANITNETLAITYCERHLPAGVEVKKALVRSEVKKALVSGKLIPGVELVEGIEELYVSGEKETTREGISNAAA